MSIQAFLEKVKQTPNEIKFPETIAVIEENYNFTPTAFQNGTQHNAAGENSGSCKLFSFAKLQNLTKEETLACFGAFYFEEVLTHFEKTAPRGEIVVVVAGKTIIKEPKKSKFSKDDDEE